MQREFSGFKELELHGTKHLEFDVCKISQLDLQKPVNCVPKKSDGRITLTLVKLHTRKSFRLKIECRILLVIFHKARELFEQYLDRQGHIILNFKSRYSHLSHTPVECQHDASLQNNPVFSTRLRRSHFSSASMQTPTRLNNVDIASPCRQSMTQVGN